MMSFDHKHVMTLRGVCLDGGPVPYIILPFMANGSLLSYLQRERSQLVVTNEIHSQVSSYYNTNLVTPTQGLPKLEDFHGSHCIFFKDTTNTDIIV